jgi:N-acetylglutamate synthase-like GNAT family acetyltransferase
MFKGENVQREVILTPATETDVPFIAGLLEENGLPSSDIPEKRASLFLARSDGSVVGTGGVEVLGEYGLLRSLAVVSEERGRGYGSAVARGLCHHARQAGVRELYLLTTTAAPFFEGLGFTRVPRDLAPTPITQTSEFSSL